MAARAAAPTRRRTYGPGQTADELAAEAVARLRRAGRARTARQARTYFKPHEPIALFGVRTPAVRRLAAELYRRVRTEWTVQDAQEFCDRLLCQPYVEGKALGIIVLARFAPAFGPSTLRLVRRWMERGCCAEWSTTDALSLWILSPLVQQNRALRHRLYRWTASHNLWLRRSAAVALVPLARRGEALDWAYRTASALLEDQEDLVQKATGWLLREAGRTQRARLARFLRHHGPDMPRTALRYSLEHLPPAERRAVLARTRRARHR